MKISKVITQMFLVLPLAAIVAAPLSAEAAPKREEKKVSKKNQKAKKEVKKKKGRKANARGAIRREVPAPRPTPAAPINLPPQNPSSGDLSGVDFTPPPAEEKPIVYEVSPPAAAPTKSASPTLTRVEPVNGALIPLGLVKLWGEKLDALKDGDVMVNVCCKATAFAEDGGEDIEVLECGTLLPDVIESDGSSAVAILPPDDMMCEFPEFALVKEDEKVGESVKYTGRFVRANFELLKESADGLAYGVGTNRTQNAPLSPSSVVRQNDEICLHGVGGGLGLDEHELSVTVGNIREGIATASGVGGESTPEEAALRFEFDEEKLYRSLLCFRYTPAMAAVAKSGEPTKVNIKVGLYTRTVEEEIFLNLGKE